MPTRADDIHSLPLKFPKLRSRLTDLTIRSLEDKSSSVRKNCLALLTKLILTHPYGRMHGGELSMTDWSERYEALGKELEKLDLPSVEEAEARAAAIELMREDEDEPMEAIPEGDEDAEEEDEEEEEESGDDDDPQPKKPKKSSPTKKKPRKSDGIDLAAASQSDKLATVDGDTLNRLRLTKQYYADAIGFISQLDRAMSLIADLIASKVKSEVLEAMEFFKVAYEYKIEAADVRSLSLRSDAC